MTSNSTPLLSVVIPTHKRPQYLQGAIESALQASPEGDVEVIVVPNGPDESWKSLAINYKKDARILWQPIAIAHANAARNRGMSIARGKYLRFLDDDDRLSAAGAVEQLSMLEASKLDICTGPVDAVGNSDEFIKRMPLPHIGGDLYCMIACHQRLCLPTAHVFLREKIMEFSWNEVVNVEQDTEWMLRISAERDWPWIATNTVVGFWTQHNDQRTSGTANENIRARLVTKFLLDSIEQLTRRGAWDDIRKDAVADGLWGCVHQGFYFSPIHWSRVARMAQNLSPSATPPDRLFSKTYIRHIDPLVIEWLMIPKRWINQLSRRINKTFQQRS